MTLGKFLSLGFFNKIELKWVTVDCQDWSNVYVALVHSGNRIATLQMVTSFLMSWMMQSAISFLKVIKDLTQMVYCQLFWLYSCSGQRGEDSYPILWQTLKSGFLLLEESEIYRWEYLLFIKTLIVYLLWIRTLTWALEDIIKTIKFVSFPQDAVEETSHWTVPYASTVTISTGSSKVHRTVGVKAIFLKDGKPANFLKIE